MWFRWNNINRTPTYIQFYMNCQRNMAFIFPKWEKKRRKSFWSFWLETLQNHVWDFFGCSMSGQWIWNWNLVQMIEKYNFFKKWIVFVFNSNCFSIIASINTGAILAILCIVYLLACALGYLLNIFEFISIDPVWALLIEMPAVVKKHSPI